MNRVEENPRHITLYQTPKVCELSSSRYGLDRGDVDGQCDMIAPLLDEIPIRCIDGRVERVKDGEIAGFKKAGSGTSAITIVAGQEAHEILTGAPLSEKEKQRKGSLPATSGKGPMGQ